MPCLIMGITLCRLIDLMGYLIFILRIWHENQSEDILEAHLSAFRLCSVLPHLFQA